MCWKESSILIFDLYTGSIISEFYNFLYALRYKSLPVEFPLYLNISNSTISSFEFQNIDDDKNDKKLK
jgi:hypothetical protein